MHRHLNGCALVQQAAPLLITSSATRTLASSPSSGAGAPGQAPAPVPAPMAAVPAPMPAGPAAAPGPSSSASNTSDTFYSSGSGGSGANNGGVSSSSSSNSGGGGGGSSSGTPQTVVSHRPSQTPAAPRYWTSCRLGEGGSKRCQACRQSRRGTGTFEELGFFERRASSFAVLSLPYESLVG